MGLMLSGMLLGHMPTVGVSAVSVGGLTTRNLYEPLFKGKSEKHYLRVGQISIIVVLAMSIVFAMMFSDLFEMFIFMIRFGIYFGVAIWLIGHLAAVWAAKRDPAFVDVVRRHLRYPPHLAA